VFFQPLKTTVLSQNDYDPTMIPDIDVRFDFTTDTPRYWDRFWENGEGLGKCSQDPDSHSPTLRRYHRILWSRELPNGEIMDLKEGYGGDYLVWNGMRFASDSIATEFRHMQCKELLRSIESSVDDYRGWAEDIIRKSYTIGGMMIFPKHRNSINQIRGNSRKIVDRWDLTLECIRRFYSEEDSPMSWCLEKDRRFFDLFVDFKGFVDFFMLQDCVSNDYSKIKMWIDTEPFEIDPYPKDKDEYLQWTENCLGFVEKRNKRISKLIKNLKICDQ